MEVLNLFCNNETLELKYKEHALKGKLKGIRDCHKTWFNLNLWKKKRVANNGKIMSFFMI